MNTLAIKTYIFHHFVTIYLDQAINHKNNLQEKKEYKNIHNFFPTSNKICFQNAWVSNWL